MSKLEFNQIQKVILVILLGIILITGSIFLYRLRDKDILFARDEVLDKSSNTESICVYVCGEVKSSGIYNLPYGSRVKEAVECAGVKEGSDLTKVNLALILYDEDMVYVPKKGEKKRNSYYKVKSKKSSSSLRKSRLKPKQSQNLSKSKSKVKKENFEKLKSPEDSFNQLLEEEGIIEVKKR